MKRIPALLLVAAFIAGTAAQIDAYVLNPYKWLIPKVTMNIQMGTAAVSLIDASGTWNKAVSPGLSPWNAKMKNMRFGAGANMAAAKKGLNNINNVFFASNIYGRGFGGSTLAVAITWYFTSTKRAVESDVIFNTKWKWNSYRGNLLSSSVDIRRVAIHEFGHTLGLGHSSNATAIMRPIISNQDKIGADDIAGAQKIYGVR